LRFVGFELRGALPDALLQRFIETAQFALGFLRGRDVMGDPDKADMLSLRIPARLRFRSHPAPYAVGPAISRFQHERLERGLAGDTLAHQPALIVGVKNFAPVEHDRLAVFLAEKIQIGLVGEAAGAVEVADPHRHRGAVGDQPEALLAFPQKFLRQRALGDVHMGADQAKRPAGFVAFDLRLGGDPAQLTVARPDDAVLGRIARIATVHGRQEMMQRAVAVLGMDSLDPVVVGIDRIRA
jgi:hypothetical protein